MTATLSRTGKPDALLPLARRETRECLAEDLRGWMPMRSTARRSRASTRCSTCETAIVETYPDTDALVAAAGDRLVGAITAADRGARAGVDRADRRRHRRRAAQARRRATASIDWSKVHVFWGDERYVPADDDERNDKQAREALLDHIDIPAANVHAMPASDGEYGDDLDAAALAYEQVLAANAEDGDPARISTCTCSAWAAKATSTRSSRTPRGPRETRLVVGVADSPKPPPRRVTLTLPAVRRAREVWLVVAGAAKAEAVAAAVGGADPVDVPAAGAVGPTPRCGCSTRTRPPSSSRHPLVALWIPSAWLVSGTR